MTTNPQCSSPYFTSYHPHLPSPHAGVYVSSLHGICALKEDFITSATLEFLFLLTVGMTAAWNRDGVNTLGSVFPPFKSIILFSLFF